MQLTHWKNTPPSSAISRLLKSKKNRAIIGEMTAKFAGTGREATAKFFLQHLAGGRWQLPTLSKAEERKRPTDNRLKVGAVGDTHTHTDVERAPRSDPTET